MPLALPTLVKTREDVCPIERKWSLPSKYYIQPHKGNAFSEISSIAFSSQTFRGNRVAYVASDKEQDTLWAVYFHIEQANSDNIEDKDEDGNNAAVEKSPIMRYVGSPLLELKLNITTSRNHDWESLSMGPCDNNNDSSGKACIYVGNTGNNEASPCQKKRCDGGRKEVEIYKIPEPNFEQLELEVIEKSSQLPVTMNVNVQTIQLSYEKHFSSETNDVEAMFVDIVGDATTGDQMGDIYIITKNPHQPDRMRIGKVPVEAHAKGTNNSKNGASTASEAEDNMSDVAVQVKNMGLPWMNRGQQHYSGGDMSPDGRLIALRTTMDVYFFPRLAGTSVIDSISGAAADPCEYMAPTSRSLDNERRFEAVAFSSATSLAETTECDGRKSCEVPVYMYDIVRATDDKDKSMSLPLLEDGRYDNEESSMSLAPPLNDQSSTRTILTHDTFDSSNWKQTNYEAGGMDAQLVSDPALQKRVGGSTCRVNHNMEDPDDITSSSESSFGDDKSSNSTYYMARIDNNNGVESSFIHRDGHDCRDYDSLEIEFDFFTKNLKDTSDHFMLEYSAGGGGHWMVIEDWSLNQNMQCYSPIAKIAGEDLGGFSRNVKLRFRSNANGSRKKIYITRIVVTGVTFH
jgi:hypothetical protein